MRVLRAQGERQLLSEAAARGSCGERACEGLAGEAVMSVVPAPNLGQFPEGSRVVSEMLDEEMDLPLMRMFLAMVDMHLYWAEEVDA